MQVTRILLIVLMVLPLRFNHAFSQKVRLALWNYYLEKFYISDQITPLDGFCFKSYKSIRNIAGTGEKNEEEVDMVHLIIVDASSGKKILCTGGFDEKVELYNMRIRPEGELNILSTQKNYFSPNICRIKDGHGQSGMMKFSGDRLLIFDKSDRLIGEFHGELIPMDEIEIFLYDTINNPEQEKIY